jgi:hypothetical protein
LLKGDRSSCDGTFFLKVNRYKLSPRNNAQKSSYQVDSFRKHLACATAFVKYAGQSADEFAHHAASTSKLHPRVGRGAIAQTPNDIHHGIGITEAAGFGYQKHRTAVSHKLRKRNTGHQIPAYLDYRAFRCLENRDRGVTTCNRYAQRPLDRRPYDVHSVARAGRVTGATRLS